MCEHKRTSMVETPTMVVAMDRVRQAHTVGQQQQHPHTRTSMVRTPTMVVAMDRVRSVVPSATSDGLLLSAHSCAIDVAMADRKMRPTSWTCF